jgi:hypothetical protein
MATKPTIFTLWSTEKVATLSANIILPRYCLTSLSSGNTSMLANYFLHYFHAVLNPDKLFSHVEK